MNKFCGRTDIVHFLELCKVCIHPSNAYPLETIFYFRFFDKACLAYGWGAVVSGKIHCEILCYLYQIITYALFTYLKHNYN